MFANCTSGNLVYDKIGEVEPKIITVILFILLGLKLKSKCTREKIYTVNSKDSVETA